MSSYRDDVNEVGVAFDSTWAGLHAVAESTARGGDKIFFGLKLFSADLAHGSDQIIDRMKSILLEWGFGSDQVQTFARVSNLLIEQGRAQDAVLSRSRQWLQETARANDEVHERLLSQLSEKAVSFDTVLGQRKASQLLQERARGQDLILGIQRTLVSDTAYANDAWTGKAKTHSLVQDWASALDFVLDSTKAKPIALTSTAHASSMVLDSLMARTLVQDASAVGWDELLSADGLIGQAWTTETENWAMSRYSPFAFTSLAVIDGTAYASGPDGIYVLDGEQETVSAELRTGKVDLTGDALATPVASYIEYELAGRAWMDVIQTQGGKAAQSFTYPLAARTYSEVMTNARFEFGRGLNARHFAFTLRMVGQRAHINDWGIQVAPSKRKI